MLLPDELIQRLRPHPLRQRLGSSFLRIRNSREQAHTNFLCRAASYKITDAATPAFSDSTFDECGMVITSSSCASTSRGNPAPSFPMTSATLPLRSTLSIGLPLCDDVPTNRTPRSRNFFIASTNFAATH